MSDNVVASKIAQYLLEIQAVKLRPDEPFTWASGWKSPIYCDNRLSLSYPEIRTYIKKQFSGRILKEFPGTQAVVGVATAGIAPGALVADELGLPFAYIRPEPKSHGRQNQLEGDLRPGTKAVVLEDLVSTGKSSLKAVEALRKEGIEVVGMASIFSYGFPDAVRNFDAHQCPWFSLSSYEALITRALEMGYISASQLENLKIWRENPSAWG